MKPDTHSDVPVLLAAMAMLSLAPTVQGDPLALVENVANRAPGVARALGLYRPMAVAKSASSASVEGAGPSRETIEVDFSVVIPAGEVWNSAVRFNEACAFDLAIDFNETFRIATHSNHTIFQIEIRDIYTNLATGFSFIDRARYSIHLDHATNLATHTGVFWQVDVPGAGVEVKDMGWFVQDWSFPFPFPILEMRGANHEVGSLPFGTLSYCDWAQGIFP